jgi:hypothetical protein
MRGKKEFQCRRVTSQSVFVQPLGNKFLGILSFAALYDKSVILFIK